ncbi:MAG: hypothetical protein ACXWV4_01180 [Flavitalea sp.]
MHNEAQIILQQVFNKRSLNDVSLSELKELTEKYPYFNAAQFLLAKKLRLEKAETSSAKHPSLFFHNPLWFNFLMKKEFITTEEIVEDELVLDSNKLAVDSETSEETEQQQEEIEVQQEKTEQQQEPTEQYQEQTEQHLEVFAQSETEPENDIDPQLEVNEEKVLVPEKSLFSERSFIHASPKDESLEFEPFHTIDYFASQGIKLRQADLSKDKFGQQLKSFTDWLKSMKKIPAPSPDDTGDPVVQEQVVQFAQVSNETKEIITETMAEVWSLQGNRQKAIDIYKKLSLQNPAKSAYFASKIDKLNS